MTHATLTLSIVCIVAGTLLATLLDDTHIPLILIGAGVTALSASTYRLEAETKKEK
ncbi:MAG: hypothetical protein Unbinned2819contig1000_18 [Prokaryotic dsDNA virus sp.]|nr:MAG: hypothetical protein Unbinned2819contig1000_18 [Prokaryotic dsDNA virus sp.]|tara:strand:- start:4563 stop:4730 length:168 start_codon:yes stop_codon:yes gene_type:complete